MNEIKTYDATDDFIDYDWIRKKERAEILKRTEDPKQEIRNDLEKKLDTLLSQAKIGATNGDISGTDKSVYEAIAIAKQLDSDKLSDVKKEKSTLAYASQILVDLAFNAIQYDVSNEVRYTQVVEPLYIDSEGVLSILHGNDFVPIFCATYRDIPKEKFNESIDVWMQNTASEITEDGKTQIYMEDRSPNNKNKRTLIATFDPLSQLEDKITYEPVDGNQSPYIVKPNGLNWLATKKISATRYGHHQTLIGENGIVYSKIRMYKPDEVLDAHGILCLKQNPDGQLAKELFSAYVSSSENVPQLVPGQLQDAFHNVKKGYVEVLLDRAITYAKTSDMTNDYFWKQFEPQITQRKIEAENWASKKEKN